MPARLHACVVPKAGATVLSLVVLKSFICKFLTPQKKQVTCPAETSEVACVVVQVLVRQRELGLAQIAGTSDMPIDGQLPLANAGFVLGTPAALLPLPRPIPPVTNGRQLCMHKC